MVESSVYTLLSTNPALSALIQSRIFPLLLPDESTYPAVTYQRASTVRDYTSTGPVDLTTIRLQVDCWHSKYLQCKQVAAAVRSCLEGYRGTPAGGTHIDDVTVDVCYDLYESAAKLFRVSIDFLIVAVE